MTYESFKENLIAALQVHFPVGTSVFIQQFQRNNHILLDGLSILEPGSNISPTIYLSQYYADCQKGFHFQIFKSASSAAITATVQSKRWTRPFSPALRASVPGLSTS